MERLNRSIVFGLVGICLAAEVAPLAVVLADDYRSAFVGISGADFLENILDVILVGIPTCARIVFRVLVVFAPVEEG
ncbi:MAG: hypothetical protein MJZ61_02190 [Bacteroidales bacterium]|nr:hypothetical protein [Bacteroidales bacterium]